MRLLIFFLMGFSLLIPGCQTTKRKQDVLVDQIFNDMCHYMHEHYNAVCYEWGGSRMNQVEELSLSFLIREGKSVQQSREIMLDFKNKFLERVNSDADLRPYLANTPFTEANLTLSISFENEDGSDITYPNVSVVHLVNNKLIFMGLESNGGYKFRTIKKVPLEEKT
jgi:hypothetical protein